MPTTSINSASKPSSKPGAHSAPAEPIRDFNALPWQERLELITRMMREVSNVRNPNEMVDVYGSWMQSITPVDRFVSLSRRELASPYYRITRSGLWEEQGVEIDPWSMKLPMLDRGILGANCFTRACRGFSTTSPARPTTRVVNISTASARFRRCRCMRTA